MRTFFIFALLNFLILIWEQRYLPETKGKSLEYLEEELASGSDARDPGPLAIG